MKRLVKCARYKSICFAYLSESFINIVSAKMVTAIRMRMMKMAKYALLNICCAESGQTGLLNFRRDTSKYVDVRIALLQTDYSDHSTTGVGGSYFERKKS